MPSLPTPGGDQDIWGDELNAWLTTEHNPDGSHKALVGVLEYPFPTPGATWTINHALGRYPAVQVLDASGEEVDADVVSTTTQTVIVFATPTAGRVLLT